MYRFWDEVIKLLFIDLKPKKIVEIGAATGENTRRILDYCQLFNSHLTVIDPEPQFDVEKWSEAYPNNLKIIKDFSLRVLPQLEDYDIVLIDGDHNWYTVYNELKQIEKMAVKKGKFPVVCLHDTEWPFGRRDMYYFPETIPEEFRHPYAKKGIQPGKSELVDEGGYFETLNNALYENGARNGVLTAIEDFLNETELSVNFFRIYSNHGLGILIPNQEEMIKTVQFILTSASSSLSVNQYPLAVLSYLVTPENTPGVSQYPL
ncbi:class I SAM-dependent methyltransferase [Lihuaxuella thermophila]|uniref:Methyltransferase domain-containing protein n=1 Tax=Lihuaxuella thermophila TaxID=1173111 RepID=A0A1H8JDK9_9BACL|nr:class I SAM-dependent methyltransferase [Lihuaxuella thermophila]SEN78829.1 Methyltransferase domain-containing protein [Lihuaxuella thermophila]